jgi:4-hydroxybenzoate polyprenyltransferase
MFGVLLILSWWSELRWMGLLGVGIAGVLLVHQHRLVRADDLSRLNAAFFTTNAYVSIILFVAIAADLLFQSRGSV